jgi:cytochrome P450
MPADSKSAEPLRDDAASVSEPASARAFFDSAQNAWVLSRYQDVLDSLREPALRQEGPEKAPPQVRNDVSTALLQPKLSEWEKQIAPLADRILASLPPDRPIELVSEVIRPWSLAVTAVVLELDASQARRLAAFAPYVSANHAGMETEPVSRRSLTRMLRAVRRRVANARLQRLLRSARVPGVQSLFLGLTQTIPEFLANAWLALLRNPDQLRRLHSEPELIPRAIEELLRYSGPVHTLARRADQTVELAGVTVSQGERVILKMALANRDPGHFSDPNSLDLARRSAGHLALGGGAHSCVGALLVRMAAISATRAFVERLAGAELTEPVVWRRGSTLASPCLIRVLRRG